MFWGTQAKQDALEALVTAQADRDAEQSVAAARQLQAADAKAAILEEELEAASTANEQLEAVITQWRDRYHVAVEELTAAAAASAEERAAAAQESAAAEKDLAEAKVREENRILNTLTRQCGKPPRTLGTTTQKSLRGVF